MQGQSIIKKEKQTIQKVRTFALSPKVSLEKLITELSLVWNISIDRDDFSELLGQQSIVDFLALWKKIIDKNYPEYKSNHSELSWALTIYKLALPLEFIKNYKEMQNNANYPLFLVNENYEDKIKETKSPQTEPVFQLKKTVEETTLDALSKIAGFMFYEDKTNNPFVKEISKQLMDTIMNETEKEIKSQAHKIKQRG